MVSGADNVRRGLTGEPRVQHRVQGLQHHRAGQALRAQGAAATPPVYRAVVEQAQAEQAGGGGAGEEKEEEREEAGDAGGQGKGAEPQAGYMAKVCQKVGEEGRAYRWCGRDEHIQDA